jgi:DNA-directed RNA polymerase specialized sigma24 family protein
MLKMPDYHSKAVDRLFQRNESKLKQNMNKLIATTGFYTGSREEVWQELCILFYQNFVEYYETDRQYLSFLFICLKNRIRNMQKKQYTREGRFITDLGSIQSGLGIHKGADDSSTFTDQYESTWGQVQDPCNSFNDMEMQEIITNSKKLLDKVGQEVLDALMCDRHVVKEVSEAMKLQKIKHPTPAERRRLNILEKRAVNGTTTISEAIQVIEVSIRPSLNKSELSRSCI